MASCGSITNWLRGIRAGDQAAGRALYDRYYQQAVEVAVRRLRGKRLALADGEDVAHVALASLLQGAVAGKFARLADRNDLWQLLVVLTVRKAVNAIHHDRRQKRDGRRTVSNVESLDELKSSEPSPDFDEYFQHLLDRLPTDNVRAVALLRFHGYSNAEIAAELQIALRSVERMRHLIRSIWAGEIES